MKRLHHFLIIVLIESLLFFTLYGCSNNESNHHNDNTIVTDDPVNSDDPDNSDNLVGNIIELKSSNLNTIYTSIINLQSVTKSKHLNRITKNIKSTDSISFRTLSHINSDGNNKPIIFVTDNEQEVVLSVTSVKQINNSLVAFSYNKIVRITYDDNEIFYDTEVTVSEKKGLIDFQNNKIYDISDYNINNAIVDNNYLFMKSNYIIYRVDINDLTKAIPLNNSEFFHASDWFFKPYSGANYIINAYNTSLTENSSMMLLDINGISVPKTITSYQISSSTLTVGTSYYELNIGRGVSFCNNTFMCDENGDVWAFDLWGLKYSSTTPERYYAISKVSVDSNGASVVTNYSDSNELSFDLSCGDIHAVFADSSTTPVYYNSPCLLNSKERLYIVGAKGGTYKAGFFYVRRIDGGGIKIDEDTLFDNDLSFPALGTKHFTRYGNYLYWIKDGSIKRMNIAKNNIIENYYINSSIIETTDASNSADCRFLTISNGYLLFKAYMTATKIGTYKLKIGETVPELIAESDVQIKDIVELSL